MNYCQNKERGILERGNRKVVQQVVPHAATDHADAMVPILTNHHLTNNLVARRAHLLYLIPQHVCQHLPKMAASGRAVADPFHVAIQCSLEEVLNGSCLETAVLIRPGPVSALQLHFLFHSWVLMKSQPRETGASSLQPAKGEPLAQGPRLPPEEGGIGDRKSVV